MIPFFYILNIILLISACFALRLKHKDRQFAHTLFHTLLFLPILAGEYIFTANNLLPQLVPMILFSESIFSLLWFIIAQKLLKATSMSTINLRKFRIAQWIIGTTAIGAGGAYIATRSICDIAVDGSLICPSYGFVYIYALIMLLAMLFMAWKLEAFWRQMPSVRRWEYKYLAIGILLVCGSLVWASSYRLTYLRLTANHFLLLAILLLLAWLFMLYAVARHRLLNRKLYVSRKIVYSILAPSIFAGYLLSLGIISLLIRIFGWSMPFVLQWLLVVLGLVTILALALSGKTRHQIKYFISTNFYLNKYDYRDKWRALSNSLQGKLTETEVVKALDRILSDTLYTTNVAIWTGDKKQGYKLANKTGITKKTELEGNDPLLHYLQTYRYFYLQDAKNDSEWQMTADSKKELLALLNVVLLVPLSIDDQTVGLIGIGPEFTGGLYGHEDFDLLSALGSQTASALLAVKMAEQLAQAREQEAWNALSAFVLHDVKNAATMLSLIRENAPDHIDNPEFQEDMLETIDDALKRMTKVQKRLKIEKGNITPIWQNINICELLKNYCRRLGKKLSGLTIDLHCPDEIVVHTDPELLSKIMENLLLNAMEAGDDETVVQINVRTDDALQVRVEIVDNGPGIPKDLLPDALFEPFKTDKAKGSGIGLWQVKQFVTSLQGSISAENMGGNGGARFIVKLPMNEIDHSNKTS